jgi:hypothetical protein
MPLTLLNASAATTELAQLLDTSYLATTATPNAQELLASPAHLQPILALLATLTTG